MEKNFSKFLESQVAVLKDIVNKLSKKYEYVSLLGSDCEGKKIVVTEKNVSVKDSDWQERGFVIRVFQNGLFSEYSFNKITTAKEIINQVNESVDISEQLYKSIYIKAGKNALYEEEKMTKEFSRMDEYEDVPIPEIISQCQKIIQDSMEENEYIISGKCNIEFLKTSKIFISPKKLLKQTYCWADATYSCIVNRNKETRYNYGSASGCSLKAVIDKLIQQINNVNVDATLLLDSTYVEPGEYDCITSPGLSGLIAHEAFGHGVEMDMFLKNRALGKDYVGRYVGSELVELHEGAIPFNDVASYFFDDEGTLASNTIEIKNGILLTGIADAVTAAQLNIKPTSNGRRESFERKVYTRMTSTYFEPKESTLEEMIASINYGFLLDGESGGMEDPKNWGIQCVALIGKEIKDGKLTGKIISPIILTGYVIDLLSSVSMVSKDFELYGSGACGKGYKEWVKTAIGGPYMKVRVKLG